MCPHKSWFKNYIQLLPTGTIFLGDGNSKLAEGLDTISIKLESGPTVNGHNVLYVLGLSKSLISIGQMSTFDVKLMFENNVYWLKFESNSNQILKYSITKNANLCLLGQGLICNTCLSITSTNSQVPSLKWHAHLEHASMHVIFNM